MIAAVVIGLVMAIPATPAITSQMGIMGHVVIKHLDSEHARGSSHEFVWPWRKSACSGGNEAFGAV